MIEKVRKRPLLVEAMMYTGDNAEEIAEWIGRSVIVNHNLSGKPMTIETLEGDMGLMVGNYLIKGIKGEFYPCRTDIFHESYYPAEEGGNPWENVVRAGVEACDDVDGIELVVPKLLEAMYPYLLEAMRLPILLDERALGSQKWDHLYNEKGRGYRDLGTFLHILKGRIEELEDQKKESE